MIISWFLLLICVGFKKNLNHKIVFSDVVFSKDKTEMVFNLFLDVRAVIWQVWIIFLPSSVTVL